MQPRRRTTVKPRASAQLRGDRIRSAENTTPTDGLPIFPSGLLCGGRATGGQRLTNECPSKGPASITACLSGIGVRVATATNHTDLSFALKYAPHNNGHTGLPSTSIQFTARHCPLSNVMIGSGRILRIRALPRCIPHNWTIGTSFSNELSCKNTTPRNWLTAPISVSMRAKMFSIISAHWFDPRPLCV